MGAKLIIVVPCYNEEETLGYTTQKLTEVINRLKEKKLIGEGNVLYVDDGSKDNTWQLIERLTKESQFICGLKLAHNVGHQYALWAGLEWASVHGDVSISIDADLQDDTDVIDEMLSLYNEGKDIVFGVRKDRKVDSWLKRRTALFFYSLMRNLGEEIIYNHADFRLMSRRSMDFLLSYSERNLLLRGIIPRIGLPTACVYYDRKERKAGVSKYPLSKMFELAMDGVTSFSMAPLRCILLTGLVMVCLSILAILYMLVLYFCGKTIGGWSSIFFSIWFLGGAILFSLGMIGEYVGKVYREVKRRPRYFVEKEIADNLKDESSVE